MIIRKSISLLALSAACFLCEGSVVSDARKAGRIGDFEGGERLIAAYRQAHGVTSEFAAAIAWLGRGALSAKDYQRAEQYAGQAREASLELLKQRRLDEDKLLATALGNAIEVQAQVMVARRELSEAIVYLNEALDRWSDTPIRARIQKNIHLLSLEGKPAPPLELNSFVGPKPTPLAELKGKVLLLFFWAHWCPDCKSEAPVLARLQAEHSNDGLVIIGPTKLYGFASRGSEADPETELAYIDAVRKNQYGAVAGMAVPVSEENFANYGSSTTPTIVLVDREGTVRLYHPGEMTYEELAPKIAELL